MCTTFQVDKKGEIVGLVCDLRLAFLVSHYCSRANVTWGASSFVVPWERMIHTLHVWPSPLLASPSVMILLIIQDLLRPHHLHQNIPDPAGRKEAFHPLVFCH